MYNFVLITCVVLFREAYCVFVSDLYHRFVILAVAVFNYFCMKIVLNGNQYIKIVLSSALFCLLYADHYRIKSSQGQ